MIARIREIDGVDQGLVIGAVAGQAQPAVFRGVASHWPLVRKWRESPASTDDYLLEYYAGAAVTAFVGEPGSGERIFYSDNLAAMNFRQIKTGLDELLERIRAIEAGDASQTVYMGSTSIDYCLPGLREHNSLPTGDVKASVRIWIGNRSTVAAHYDVPENIACVCAGRRRFTLFPPDQLANLYVGPIDFTPAGQPVSLVDLDAPDLDRYPKFAEALAHAQQAELEPGDAIYIPGMWWHHVSGLDKLNILINHWWRESPAYMGAPGDALLHAILSIRDLPAGQRDAWRGIFEHYVFSADEAVTEHIPADRRGALGRLDEDTARQIRTLLRNGLQR